MKITYIYPEVGMASLNLCDPQKLLLQNFTKRYSAKIVPLKDLASYGMFIGKSNSYMSFTPPGSSMVLPRPLHPPESN